MYAIQFIGTYFVEEGAFFVPLAVFLPLPGFGAEQDPAPGSTSLTTRVTLRPGNGAAVSSPDDSVASGSFQ